MVTRSLTEVFILMRNNAMQSRHIFSEQTMDDRMALVTRDIELGSPVGRDNKLPPHWVDGVEEYQYEITRINQKMKELALLHDKHLHRPSLDDNMDEEHAIETMILEITQMFRHCQRLVNQIRNHSEGSSNEEHRMSQNVIQSLVTTLQDLSLTFRQSQSTYMNKLQSREERSRQYFDSTIGNESIPEEDLMMDESYDKGFTKEQLFFVEDNTQMVQQREREIGHIVRSIVELNDIFKDLAHMVVDQGTIIDRIDYNIEQVGTTIHHGYQQLVKAERYQKKNRKMLCIVILAITSLVLIVILIVVKS